MATKLTRLLLVGGLVFAGGSVWADASQSVTRPVRGLYQSISPSPRMPSRWKRFREKNLDRDPYFTADFHLRYAGKREAGHFRRTYEKDKNTLVLDFASRGDVDEHGNGGIPKWIQGMGVPLVPGKGIPTVTWATLYQMRRFGIGYGKLRTIDTFVMNERSKIDLQRLRAAKLSLTEAVRETNTYRYVSTIATQSGHRIASVSINGKNIDKITARSIKNLAEDGNEIRDYKMTFNLAPWRAPRTR